MKRITLIILLLIVLSTLIIPKSVFAQTNDCYKHIAGNEFHSLRPYQASVCSMTIDEPSQICGNSMIINDTISVTQANASSCTDQGANTVLCHYTVPRSFQYRVDPSKANLPIAGNTELVSNRETATATIDHATQINDYLSWYLNGIIFRAEELHYYRKDEKTGIIDYSPIVDYAGPIRKLLPLGIQNATRKTQVVNAGVTRHDQTATCVWKVTIIPKFKIKFFGYTVLDYNGVELGGFPAPCATDFNQSFWEKLFGFLVPTPKELILSEWKDKLPPEQKPGESWQDYYKRYRDWRGDICISVKIPSEIPIVGFKVPFVGGTEFMFCFDNAYNPNYYSDRFSWIPFTSTEDKLGKLTVNSPEYVSGDVKVISSSAPSTVSTNLYFPHMEENKQLSELLSSSFVPYDLQGDNSLGLVATPQPDTNCKILDVRSNPGDKLFGQDSGWLNYAYTAQFDCTFTYTEQPVSNPLCPGGQCRASCNSDETMKGICGGPILCCVPLIPPAPIRSWTPAVCVKHATFASKVEVTTPMIDTTWAKLVAGNTSAFRRMFPKIDANTLGVIKDIPASSNVTYEVQSAGDQATVGSNPAEIYFPHLGGISEYFLKGIQTLLRPKGYGESTPFAPIPSTPPGVCGTGGSIPNLPPATGACSLRSGGNQNIPDNLARIISAAATTFQVPPSLILGIMYGEGAFNPGKYGWTNDNVTKWAGEGACMPGCNPATWPTSGVVPFFDTDWASIKNAVNTIDSGRTPNPCNLLDTVFALAKTAQQTQAGTAAFAGKSCFGILLNTGSGGSNSCFWDNSDVETAIRVWEFGTAYRDSDLSCATKDNSCAMGGSLGAQCPTGGDSCETLTNRYTNASHNGCLWNVYQNYK